eukprot:151314_1
MLALLFIATNILFDITSSSDFCAWNHARAPVGSNIGNTHNWINGEFNRDTSYESAGQSELFLGRAYYKMIMPSKCFVPVVYLFCHINAHVHPPINTWVIAGGMGTSPEESYAYCTAASDLQDTPDGSCDGQWIFKKDGTTFEDTVDSEFYIQPGGCRQVTCQTLYMKSLGEMDWMQDYDSNSGLWSGTFTYSGTPDIYKQTNNDKSQNKIDGGTYYLFWNHKTWMWAINAYIDKYSECDSYKVQTFQLVSNVIGGTYDNSMPIDGANLRFDTADAGAATRKIYCEGTIVTPNPTAQAPQIPSLAPAKNDWCKVDTSPGSQVAPSVQDYIDTYCNTPAPIVKQIFPNDPTSAPHRPGTPSTAPTDPTLPPVDPTPYPTDVTPGPSPGPTVPKGSPSRDPTLRPTPGPTVTDGNPSRPPTIRPVIVDDGQDGNDDDGEDGSEDGSDYGNKINCNMYLICVVV